MVQVNGNLKVKLPPLKTPPSYHDGQLEFVEPSVVGFIGECHRINSGCSAMDVILPLTSFSWTRTLEGKFISVDAMYVYTIIIYLGLSKRKVVYFMNEYSQPEREGGVGGWEAYRWRGQINPCTINSSFFALKSWILLYTYSPCNEIRLPMQCSRLYK